MPDSDDAAQLTTRMAAGDPAAIELFYQHYFDTMYLAARHAIGGDEATCLDIVQDALLKIVRSIRPTATTEHLHAWINKVVRSVAIDGLRQRRAQLKREMATSLRQSSHAYEDEHAQVHARLIWLEERIDQLDPESRQLMTLRYKLGWTLQRIALRIGIKTGAVDGRIRRLVEQLRQQAESSDYE